MGITGGLSSLTLDSNYVTTSVVVGTTQTALRVGASNLEGRDMIIIYNKGTTPIYIGPSGVTTATGIKVVPEQILNINLRDNISLYALTSAGTCDVVVQEVA